MPRLLCAGETNSVCARLLRSRFTLIFRARLFPSEPSTSTRISRREDEMSSPYSDARRNLLEKLLRGQAPLGSPTNAIPPRDPNEPVPLSFSQEQIWLHAQLVPGPPLYNEPVSIDYSGDLNVPALEQAFNDLLRRHEAWRTCFKVVEGQPQQDVKSELSIALPVVDLRHLPEEQREPAALTIATADSRKPLDLTQVPLFRAR